MTWVLEFNETCIEAETLKELLNDFADYCFYEDTSETIDDLFWQSNNDIICKASSEVISHFQDQCDEIVEGYNIEAKEAQEDEEQLRSYYYANLL